MYFEKTSQFMEKDVTEPSKSKAFNTYYHDKAKVDLFNKHNLYKYTLIFFISIPLKRPYGRYA